MAGIKLKHVERWKDRHGRTRYYFRRGKGKRIALAGMPGSSAFNDAYIAADNNYSRVANSNDGTLNALSKLYFASSKFLQMKAATQKQTRYIIERLIAEHGHRLVKQMSAMDVEKMFSAKANTPAAANNFLKKLRGLIKFAIKIKWIKDDPTLEFEWFKEGTYHTWTENEIELFEARHAIGTTKRLAFDLHLYTGQRRGDVAKMMQADIIGASIRVAQEKADDATEDRFLLIPLHWKLRKSIDAANRTGKHLVTTAKGNAYTVESYGHLMARAINEAGLQERCVLHGVRKAAARRLAEAGCSVHQIAAITGHKTLAMVQLYTSAVDQIALAGQAMASLGKEKIA